MGCTTENVLDNPKMTDVGDIEVTFSVDGEEVRSLDLLSVSHTIKVDVALNNDNIFWDVTSSEEWCHIVEEPHRGSGSFTLIINANDSFDARETAYVTFKAGEYEMEMLTVAHNGNVFVIDQLYAASTKSAGSFTTKVKTRTVGEAWKLECDPWIKATKGTATTDENGDTITEVTIEWEENSDVSRYGVIAFVENDKESTNTYANVWQYGTEMTYDDEGNLLLEAQDVAPLELRAPKQTIADVVMPSWVTYTIQDNYDNTVSYMLQFAGNPSDADHIRTTELELSFLSGAANIKLPVIKQKFYPMAGLVSGPGLALFAKTWNEGGDVSQWFVDGVPTILGDIDLTEVKEWVSIGTAERPWTGEFNGNGKKIINLKATQPLFGVVENATIKGIVIDETSAISVVGSYSEALHLSALAGEIKATTIESCVNRATISLDASTSTANNSIYVAGLVGKADAASIVKYSTNWGAINVPSSCTAASGSTFYIGGLVGHNSGVIEIGVNNGNIEGSVQVNSTYLGGVVGYNEVGAKIISSQNSGALTYGTQRGSESYIGYVGGISALGNGELLDNTNDGDITSKSNVQTLYVGGITTLVMDNAIKLENNTQANAADIKIEGGNTTIYAGGLAAYVATDEGLTLDYTKDTGSILGTIHAGNAENTANSTVAVGGVIGYADCPITINSLHYNGTITSDLTNVTAGSYYAYAGFVGWSAGTLDVSASTVSGAIDIPSTKQKTKCYMCYGGIVGLAESNVTIKDCENSMDIVFAANTASNSNQYPCHIGGIAGRITMGTTWIENCKNSGKLVNRHYNNNLYVDIFDGNPDGKPNATGGILGSFGFLNDLGSNDTVTIKNCSSSNLIAALRAMTAGIAGYVCNGYIDNCSYNGLITPSNTGLTQYNQYVGGIVSVAVDSTIKNCTAKLDMESTGGGSCHIRQGGIASWIRGTTTISDCAFYGTTKYTATAQSAFSGGIVGLVHNDGCTISNCKFGGNINGVTISAGNCSDYVYGIASLNNWPITPTIENITYWDGK